MLLFVDRVAHQVRLPLPLCVDENIYWRLLKLAYRVQTAPYNFHKLLLRCPPLYAIWHPYKYLIHSIWRTYFPIFTYLTWGSLKGGQLVTSKARVRGVEMLFAALLRLPNSERGNLASKEVELSGKCQRLRAICQTLRLRNDHHVTRALATAEHRLKLVRALLALLQEWMPLAYLCGRKARSVVWEGQMGGSGAMAKEVAMMCLLGLLTLKGTSAHTTEYVRTLSCALVFWSEWHSDIPGCCYSDEPNEACLSQLGRWWGGHPKVREVRQLSDVLLLLPESDPIRTLPAGSCSRMLFERVVSGVRALISGEVSHVAYVEWESKGAACKMQASWPAGHSFPPSFRETRPPRTHINNVFKHALSRLVFQHPLKPALRTLIHAHIPRRTPAEADAWRAEAEEIRTRRIDFDYSYLQAR